MKIKDFKELSKEELSEKYEALKKQLMELQFKRKAGVEKPHMFKQIKKDIARILTVSGEKQNGIKKG